MSFARVALTLLMTGYLYMPATAQDEYSLNGNAIRNSCNCYTLTQAATWQGGSVWNKTRIDISQSFDFIFNVFLGCLDANGADGIAFMLQPLSTSLGASGGGMGFEGVQPSVGILLDTWQNLDNNDPVYDHISIQANGVLTHGNDLAGPVQASATSDNIEDCAWHTLRIVWDAGQKKLSAYFDGVLRVETQTDLVADIFHNDPMVYWGFTAATGGSYNLQQFCTALNPGFDTGLPGNATCFGQSIQFSNTSASFAPVSHYYWDLGDGTTYTIPDPPAHTYAAPGLYQVKMAIRGFDGCESDTLRSTVAVGDEPVADFTVADTCAGRPPRIDDLSYVRVGTINSWSWQLNGTPVSTAARPLLTGLAPGTYALGLTVTSNYGCRSAYIEKQFTVKPAPAVSFAAVTGCAGEPVSLSATQSDNSTTITSWSWQSGQGQTASQPTATFTYPAKGFYAVSLEATASNGCVSDKITHTVFINAGEAFAGNDTMVVKNELLQLNGSGQGQYQWTPATWLSNASIANPIAMPEDDIVYTLTVTTPEGCVGSDDIKVSVFKGSAIYVPTGFTPDGNGLNDQLIPYYIGIRELQGFSVYNRWGRLVFTTRDRYKGWDGTVNGARQPSGSYVWIVNAIDFIGKKYQLKGTTVLLR